MNCQKKNYDSIYQSFWDREGAKILLTIKKLQLFYSLPTKNAISPPPPISEG